MITYLNFLWKYKMTQDTKYLDAYIKSNFNLKKMHNEFADKKDLDELNSWLNSDKYKEIINSDKYIIMMGKQ